MKKPTKTPRRATVPELAKMMERSETVVRQCINAQGVKKGKDGKYPVAPVMQEHKARQSRNTRPTSKATTSTIPGTWSDQLKAKQVEKLDVQLAELRGDLVPKDEVRGIIEQIAAAVKGALDNFVETVAATDRTPESLKWAESVRNAALIEISEAFNEGGKE